jgi:hypothetical protein
MLDIEWLNQSTFNAETWVQKPPNVMLDIEWLNQSTFNAETWVQKPPNVMLVC